LTINNETMYPWEFLSFPLSPDTPAYGGGTSFAVSDSKRMEKGDSCNSAFWSFPNHLGTHVDFPRHFVTDGKTASDYTSDFWIFHSPFLIDISPVEPGTMIHSTDVRVESIPDDTDLLLIKTGFCDLRSDVVFWKENPGFSPELAGSFRKSLPHLRLFGFDSISLSSYLHREIGRQAHKAFLSGEFPILLLEDMNLSNLTFNTKIRKVIVSILQVMYTDASPCTVFAEMER